METACDPCRRWRAVACGGGSRRHHRADGQLRAGQSRPRSRSLDACARPRRQAPARLSHERRTLAPACRARGGRSALISTSLLAYEDKRFFEHRGVDPLALARAAFQLVAQWPHRLRRLDADHAGRAADRAATEALALRASSARAVRALQLEWTSEQGRDPRALSDARALWAAISKACAPPRLPISARSRAGLRSARRRCSSRCRNRRNCVVRTVSPEVAQARARPRARPDRGTRPVQRRGDRARQARVCAARAQAHAADRAACRRRSQERDSARTHAAR